MALITHRHYDLVMITLHKILSLLKNKSDLDASYREFGLCNLEGQLLQQTNSKFCSLFKQSHLIHNSIDDSMLSYLV